MSHREPSGPDLDGVVADANAVGLPHIVIGTFAVIAHGFLRATKDSDLLVPGGTEADDAVCHFLERAGATRLADDGALSHEEERAEHLRVRSRHGIVDILRGGLLPLDFDTVSRGAIEVDLGGQRTRVASLQSIVAFKRFANRGQDRVDLERLERVHGELPAAPLTDLAAEAARLANDPADRAEMRAVAEQMEEYAPDWPD
jgi:hypothetical protein